VSDGNIPLKTNGLSFSQAPSDVIARVTGELVRFSAFKTAAPSGVPKTGDARQPVASPMTAKYMALIETCSVV
jgi:hypothetical protein